MYQELTMIIIMLLLCSIVLSLADLVVAALLSIFGIGFKKAFLWGLLSLAVPPVAMLYGALIERNQFQVKEVELEFDGLSPLFDGYTIAQISDVHLRSFQGRKKALQKAVDRINSLDADVVCFTGDLVTMDPSELDGMEPILSRLRGKDGVLSILGNHDYLIYAGKNAGGRSREDRFEELLRRERGLGWDLLQDENRIIRRGSDAIALMGVENISASSHFPSQGMLEAAMDGTDGCFRILLSHDPTHWDLEVVGKDIPLMLSGHTHAIQFSLFGWCPSRYIFKQYRGLYEKGVQKLYVNVGLGETIFPARIGAAPEITLITLRSSQAVFNK